MMKTIYKYILIAILFSGCAEKLKIKEINVSDYGIVPNTKKNFTKEINELIYNLNDEPVTILFPKGRYDFYPHSLYFRPYYETNTYDLNPKRLAILIEKKKNITIDAQGSDFIYHDHIQPFTVDNSENISIKNVNIDWDQPLTAEAEVIEADSTHILVKIDKKQFPYAVHDKGITFAADDWEAEWRLSGGSWLIEFNKKHIIPAATGDFGAVNGDLDNVYYSETSPGIVLMKGNFTKLPSVGNYLIMRHSTRDHSGILLYHSKNTNLENINVYHTSGLGILSQYCENIKMEKVNMIPNPHKNRYLSGHDDGLHFMGCKGEIVINYCDSQGLMDDPINIHGTYVPVTEKLNDNTLKCRYAHDMSCGLIWAKKGDSIGFIDKKTLNPIGVGVVSKFTPLNSEKFHLEFQNKIPEILSNEYSLENLSCTPNVIITNCFVGSNRARGFLISTPGKVLVENNIFETSGSAILIAGDANYWYESGAVKDITIRNNEFRSSCNSSPYQFCEAVISIYPEIPHADPLNPYHKNIKIINNSFNPSDYPILYAKSVNGLIFKGNSITRSYDFKPWHLNKHNFLLDACKNVEISKNKIDKDVLGKNGLLKSMQKDELIQVQSELKIEMEDDHQ
ncbi:alpha-1,3-galactosidase-related protein [Abyssalbus ytuae]|uniref:Alpha-1,3-galactosidase B n=1 Tax=Abyssalbus ytuae TaxID=2926907 RepID=A0A9E7CTQ0_9FLAO|nr:hypothetical protein [Abyssalbus ytuae]UOB18446.1 hypothetical protein MQE35_03940 [Abyssalbus ytuae]